MHFGRIETFVWVAKFKSFSKTAEQLHTTQPAISSRIATLESELGVKLFQRQANSKVRLTTKGSELLPRAEKLLFLSKDFLTFGEKTVSYEGILRLGVSETIAYSWLPTLLRRLNRIAPTITIELTVDVSTELHRQLSSGSIDIAFILGTSRNSDMANEHLFTTPLAWIASPKLDIGSEKQTLSDLSKWPIITYARNTAPFNEINQEFIKQSDKPARLFASSSLGVCHSMVLDGIGLGVLPIELIQKDIDQGSLNIISTEWHPSDLNFNAVYLNSPYRPEVLNVINMAKTVANEFIATHKPKS